MELELKGNKFVEGVGVRRVFPEQGDKEFVTVELKVIKMLLRINVQLNRTTMCSSLTYRDASLNDTSYFW